MAVDRFLHPFARPAKDDFVSIVRGEGADGLRRRGQRLRRRHGQPLVLQHRPRPGRHGRRRRPARCGRSRRTPASTPSPTRRPTSWPTSSPPGPRSTDPRVFFTSSGSEAVDSAIKLARIAQVQAGHPERTLIVSRTFGYHGVTYGGLSAQGLPPNQAGFGPLLPDFVNLPNHDLEAMANLFAERGDEIAAVITEPVQGAGGVRPPLPGYLEGLRRLCDQHGAFLIMDEVICAFGRLGHMFASDFYGVRPDLISFAKGVTSGYVPLGGVIVGAAVRDPLEADAGFWLRHGHTYSGHPTACAAGLEAMAITVREDLLERSKHVGDRLAAGLRSLRDDGLVAEARGEGAVWAVALHEGQDPVAMRDAMLGRGVITRAVGTDTLTFCPRWWRPTTSSTGSSTPSRPASADHEPARPIGRRPRRGASTGRLVPIEPDDPSDADARRRDGRAVMSEFAPRARRCGRLLRPRPHPHQRLVGFRVRDRSPQARPDEPPPARAGRPGGAHLPTRRRERRQGRPGARAHPARRGRQPPGRPHGPQPRRRAAAARQGPSRGQAAPRAAPSSRPADLHRVGRTPGDRRSLSPRPWA